MSIVTEDMPEVGVNFDSEAEKLAGTPKQGFIEDIDFEEKTDDGAETADSYEKKQQQEADTSEKGGKAYKSAKLAFTLTDMIIPTVAAMRLDTDKEKFKAKASEKSEIIELYEAFFEYHDYNFDDPAMALVVGLAIVYGMPIYDHVQSKKDAEKPASSTKAKSDEPISTDAEEVTDDDLKREKVHVVAAVNKEGERVCEWKDCKNVLAKTQKKYCSHKCRAHGSNELRK